MRERARACEDREPSSDDGHQSYEDYSPVKYDNALEQEVHDWAQRASYPDMAALLKRMCNRVPIFLRCPEDARDRQFMRLSRDDKRDYLVYLFLNSGGEGVLGGRTEMHRLLQICEE